MLCHRRNSLKTRSSELGFEQQILDYINGSNLLADCRRVLLAVSGGADSMAMLAVLSNLTKSGKLKVIICVGHINHNLRPQALHDQQYVIDFCRNLGIQAVCKSINVREYAQKNKLSIETAARQMRRKALVDIASELNCDALAAAHHADDNAETILFRLLRGTGFRGLAGILPYEKLSENLLIFRPLLKIRRREIEDYLKEKNIVWRTDATNFDVGFRRNWIRHKLLPYLQNNCENDITDLLCKLAEVCEKLRKTTEQQISGLRISALPATQTIDIQIAKNLHPVVQTELLRQMIISRGTGEQKITADHYRQMLKLLNGTSRQNIVRLPYGLCARLAGENLELIANNKMICGIENKFIFSATLIIPGEISYNQYRIITKLIDAQAGNILEKLDKFKKNKTRFIEWFDIDKLPQPLIVRNRQTGDRFNPMGINAQMRVSKFLIANKPPKGFQPVIFTDAEGRIFWLAPCRTSSIAAVDPTTRRILQIELMPSCNR